jgi:hypothetical protein
LEWFGLAWIGLEKWVFDTDFDTCIKILIQVLIHFDTSITPTNQKIPPKKPLERIKKT